MTVGTAHTLSLISTVTLSLLGVMSGSELLFAAGMVVLLVMALTFRSLRATSRARTLSFAVHAVTVGVLAGALLTLKTARIDAVLIIVMLGIVNRFILRQSSRDDFIMVGASAVLMTMATTVTSGIAFLPLVAAYIPVVAWTMLTTNALAQGRAVHRQLVPRIHTTVLWGSLGLTLIGFVGSTLFPRFNFGRILAAGGLMNFSGAGNSMRLQSGGVSASSGGEVVIRLDASDGPAFEGLYARVYALDSFNGREWSSSIEGRRTRWENASGGADVSARQTWQKLTVRRMVRDGPHPVVVLGIGRPWPVGRSELRVDGAGTVWTPMPRAAPHIEYKVSRHTSAELPLPVDRDRFLVLPPNLDPRISDLAERLTERSRTDSERLNVILQYFSDFEYSLSPVPGDASDPLVRFLFEGKRGHCELYAGAVSVLARAAGIPARVVTGYYGGWYNARGEELEFTTEDAHAWVEVLVDRRWQWVDATPPDNRTRRRGKPLAWLRDWYDWLDGVWYNYVVDFDENQRRALMADFTQRVEGGWTSLSPWQDWRLRVRSGGRGFSVFLVSTGVLVLGLLFVLGVWWTRSGVTAGRRLRRILGAEPRETLGCAVQRAPSRVRRAAARAVEVYEAYRFGGEGTATSVRRALRDLQRHMAESRAVDGRVGRGGRGGT
ncbi:MAG: transglutaminaseTgpA domain-containing protein [Myxococcota bacterium]